MSGDLVPQRRNLRASHADREQAVEQLRVAAGDGRLTADELDERLEAALTARTYGELETLVADLPPVPGTTLASAPAPKDVIRLQTRSGGIRRVGAWVVPRRLEVETHSGSAVLDFTEAVITSPALDMDISLRSGSLRLIVPPDVEVDVDGVAMHSGGVRHRARREPGTPARLLITVTGTVRSGSVVVRGPRRSFWAWLLGRPAPTRRAGS